MSCKKHFLISYSFFLSIKVIKILSKGMKLKHDNLIFALFERCGPANEKSIEDRQILADVLAKFER